MSLQSRIQVTSDGNENDSPDVKAVAERSSAVTDPFAELKTRVHREIIPRLGPRMFTADESDADLEAKVTEVVTELLAVEKTPLTRGERQDIIRQITDDILGYGPLEPFLRDDSITEVMVNDHTHDLHRAPRQSRAPTRSSWTTRTCAHHRPDHQPIGRRIDESSPLRRRPSAREQLPRCDADHPAAGVARLDATLQSFAAIRSSWPT